MWRDRLGRMLTHHQERGGRGRASRQEVLDFLQHTVAPALRSVADELARHGREADLEMGADAVSITVYLDEEEEFFYAVKARTYQRPTFAFPEITFKEDGRDSYSRAEVYTREGSQDYGILGYDHQQVIANFMHEYDKQLRWQKPTRARD